MTNNPFAPAVREQLKLRLALTGVTGSGKTMTALKLASAMTPQGRRDNGLAHIAVIDTERDSARLYAQTPGINEFDVVSVPRNKQGAIDPTAFTELVNMAAQHGYKFVIVDSLSHLWEGILDYKSTIDAKPNSNSWTNWRHVNPLFANAIDALLNYPGHIICTMRSKMKHEQVEENGRKQIVKMGLDPIMRDNIEYEFGIVMQMDSENYANVEKTRCNQIAGERFHRPGADLANILMDWLNEGDSHMNRADFVAEMVLRGFAVDSIGQALLMMGVDTTSTKPDRYETMLSAVDVYIAAHLNDELSNGAAD